MRVLLLENFSINLNFSFLTLLFFLSFIIAAGTVIAGQNDFEGKTDVGNIKLPGSIQYDEASKTYRITGSGENIWANEDAFFYAWNKTKGDLALTASIKFEGEGQNAHRKAGWMFRAGLDKDDAYVDAVVHGDGLISMQFRKIKGGPTAEVQAPFKALVSGQVPAVLLLERTGSQFTLSVTKDGKFHPVGTISVELPDEVYSGLAVCSHNYNTSETALISNVKTEELTGSSERVVESTLQIFDIDSGTRSVVYKASEHFEAPNWSRDGKTLYYNSQGKIYTIPVSGGKPSLLNTGFAVNCNNDHGLSPDGNQFVVSHHPEDGKSRIYILPSSGGEPKLVTEPGPSYWHGWSPDGTVLAYCAERNGEFDVYTIPIMGGEETRLTTAPGLDDGPDYSPDGKFIFFNSVRTGQMKIWKMKADGSDQVQVTPDDDYGDWFAHPSPDGKWIVFVSYDKSVEGHPANKDVVLRMMPAEGGEIKILTNLFGGQGTINVPSWSPDSKQFAFVSYRLVKK